MPKHENVTLKVKPGADHGQGWNTVTASNGQMYSFKYSGGHQDKGGLKTKVGDGAASIDVHVDTDHRYTIDQVHFTDDAYHQLSWLPAGDSAGAILDLNTQAEDADYAVIVADANAGGATIPCDPMIQNDPRGPKPHPRIKQH